jgi:hypothetical protein
MNIGLDSSKAPATRERASPLSQNEAQSRRTTFGRGLAAPIFVVGNVHSGTTLMQKILARHPGLYVGPGETQFYPNLNLIRAHFPDLGSPADHRGYLLYLVRLITRNFTEAEAAFRDSRPGHPEDESGTAELYASVRAQAGGIRNHEALYFMVFDAVASHNGADRWLEKTPAHLFHIDEILRNRPGARVLEMVRDPRAVLASKQARSREAWLGSRERNRAVHAAGGYDPLLHSLAWKSAHRQGAMARMRHPDNVLMLRYEDLVTAPERSLRRVCDFLDLDFDADMLQVRVSNSASGEAGPEAGISAVAVGRWQTQLPESAILVCDRVNRTEICSNGYELHRPRHPTAYLALPLIVVRSSWVLFRIAWQRWRLKGTAYLFDLGRNYLRRLRNLAGAAAK